MRRTAALLLVLAVSGCPTVPRPSTPDVGPPDASKPAALADAPTTAPASTTPSPAQTPSHDPGERLQIVEKAMGTRVTLAGYTTPEEDRAAVLRALRSAHAEIHRIERLMSTWIPDSEVSQINRAAGRSAVRVGRETLDVIAKSLWISELSQSTFDITFASMGKLWNFDEELNQHIPDAKLVEAARKRIDYRKIQLDREASTVMLKTSDTKINLGGIAKGYAIDRAAAILREAGLRSFFAQAGGDLYVEGRKPLGDAWRVGVRDPRGPDGIFFALLPVENHAFSTAGDYERAFIKNGKRYHHIIDPRTGYPATACRSVTIWAKDALTADALDDAVFILGPKKGLALVESLDDTGAVIVDANNKVHVSKRLRGIVRILRPPTDGI